MDDSNRLQIDKLVSHVHHGAVNRMITSTIFSIRNLIHKVNHQLRVINSGSKNTQSCIKLFDDKLLVVSRCNLFNSGQQCCCLHIQLSITILPLLSIGRSCTVIFNCSWKYVNLYKPVVAKRMKQLMILHYEYLKLPNMLTIIHLLRQTFKYIAQNNMKM